MKHGDEVTEVGNVPCSLLTNGQNRWHGRYLLDLPMLAFLINGYESMPDLARVSLQSGPAGCRGCACGIS